MARRSKNYDRGEELEVNKKSEVVSKPMEEPKKVEKRFPKGVVTNCLQLNVRRDPSMKSEVLTIISALDEVRINSEDKEWYEVILTDGTSGFCKKAFIAKE